MRKYIVIVVMILLITLSSLLYTNSSEFYENNIKTITLDDRELDINNDKIVSLIQLINNIKKQNKIQSFDSVLSSEMVLAKEFGESEIFQIHLDYDFSTIVITDVESNISYVVEDELVEWFYMHDAFKALYDYKKMATQEIYINNNAFNTLSETNWKYLKGDQLWYDARRSIYNLNRITLLNDTMDIQVNYDMMPTSTELQVTLDDDVVYNGKLSNEFHPASDGLYVYQITSKWQDPKFYGEIISSFEVEILTPPEFSLSKEVIEQGEILVLTGKKIDDLESLYINQSYLEGISFQIKDDFVECIIPSTYYTTPGVYHIEYGVDGYQFESNFEVIERSFELQFLFVDAQTTQSTQTAEGYDEYRQYYKAALLEDAYESNVSLSDTALFILPTTGRLTTEFGVQRYVNNKPTSYHHAGLDIANSKGTPIVATYDGQVVLAKKLIVTGNTVVISHGNGIFSTYFHMNQIDAVDGENINKGDAVGTIGTTGFSTGPHLHFSISYYQMNLEPGQFIYGEKVTYSNSEQLFGSD